ncbi:MAG: SDR family NAD(P)-dependent oxidoreductase, partial [Alphaproteobacteria bacterium]
MSFAGKTVLITGAARGFGAATAKAFSDAGANLVLGDISDEGLGEGLHSSVLTLKGDVSDPAYSRSLVNMAYETFGGL